MIPPCASQQRFFAAKGAPSLRRTALSDQGGVRHQHKAFIPLVDDAILRLWYSQPPRSPFRCSESLPPNLLPNLRAKEGVHWGLSKTCKSLKLRCLLRCSSQSPSVCDRGLPLFEASRGMEINLPSALDSLLLSTTSSSQSLSMLPTSARRSLASIVQKNPSDVVVSRFRPPDDCCARRR